MPFNPVTWNTTQPLPNQNISSGQGTIRNNFDFLQNASGNGVANADIGFFQLPNGLIVQWGITPSITSSASGVTFNFTQCTNATEDKFMQSFPTYCFGVWLMPRTNSIANKGVLAVDNSSPDATSGISRTAFKVYNAGSTYSNGAFVLAIGL